MILLKAKAYVSCTTTSCNEQGEVAEPYNRRRAIRHVEKGRVVMFCAGTGSPYFTSDSATALRVSEIVAYVILKGTRVGCVYTADPEKDPNATRYYKVSFSEVISKNLKVMDMTAFTLCHENDMPIVVFDINVKDILLRTAKGEEMGTSVNSDC